MTEAIKLALEKGGYKGHYPGDGKVYLAPLRRFGVATALKMFEAYISQDPLFWQALGRALGWKVYRCTGCLMETNDEKQNFCFCNDRDTTAFPSEHPPKWSENWLVNALRYLKLVLTGVDTEKFWEELLKPLV